MKWLEDANGNRCSIEYFGSEEAAQRALDSLKNCKECTNCSDCSDCSECSGCYGCSDCSDCSECSGCSDCSDCSGCYGCSDCSECSECSGCYDCSDCSGCSGCSDCSHCSECSGCSDCSECSECSGCYGRSDKTNSGAPLSLKPIPAIPNIHQTIYQAASAPGALSMDNWHTCEKTHCRAGWAVTLAGPDGKELEKRLGTVVAAMMIYDASDPNYKINPCRFFEGNDAALADMKKLAEAK